jgi:actin related protein 2/3 complex subunit 3
MPAYHSAFNGGAQQEVCAMALLPLKSRARGPALAVDPAGQEPPHRSLTAGQEPDIVDEALTLFRANVLFRNFEVQGSADRVLIYLTLFIHQVRNGKLTI